MRQIGKNDKRIILSEIEMLEKQLKRLKEKVTSVELEDLEINAELIEDRTEVLVKVIRIINERGEF